MRFWLNQPLRDQAGDGDGGGSGSGNGGSGAPAGGALTLEAIEALFDKKLNGYDKKIQGKLAKLGQPAPKADDGGEGDGDGSDGTGTTKTKTQQGSVDPEVAKLRKQLEQMNKRQAEADAEREREKTAVREEKKDAAIRKELAKFNFIDDEAFESGYARLARDIKFAEDGSLVGGADEMPLGKFVGERMAKMDFLTKPREVGGAGAANGGKQTAGGEIDIDDIKPGMTAEQIAKVMAKLSSFTR